MTLNPHLGPFQTVLVDELIPYIDDMDAFKEKNKLVFVSYGGREVGRGGRRGRGGDPKADVDALKDAGINSHYYISPETGHEWQSWRRSLREFAPLLFKE